MSPRRLMAFYQRERGDRYSVHAHLSYGLPDASESDSLTAAER
ncbi:MAG TPA: hypothetical protein VEY91_11170 [Candidatus Limnocylindria bacterium]|nr:hypothetical protein [Candidatus Limnocylindria bacterium]